MNHFKVLTASLILAGLIVQQLAFADSNKVENISAEQEIQIIVMRNAAKSVNRLADKINACHKTTASFQLNEEDRKHLKRYKTFFVGLSLLNLKNDSQCYLAEEIQVEKEMKKAYSAFKSLSILPQYRKGIETLTDSAFRKATDNAYFNKLSRIHPNVLIYLKKRVGNKRYDQAEIFKLMEKHSMLGQ